jgi:hypothetical protein
MFYFQQELTKSGVEYQRITSKLENLHGLLYPRLRNHSLDLHPRWQKHMVVARKSAASLSENDTAVLTYFRSQEQAEMVEKLMGKERAAMSGQVDSHRHPVIELRLTPEHFVIELVVSPYAWWDQQNLIGKLDLPHQRSSFRNLMKILGADYRIGFWQGTELDDMHLTVGHLLHGRMLDEWMNTFCDGHDWLRIGKWYEHSDPQMDAENIQAEAFKAIKALNAVYTFILWSSNNNFRNFYEKRATYSPRRAYAV